MCEAREAGRRGLSSSLCAPGSALQQGLRSARGAVEFLPRTRHEWSTVLLCPPGTLWGLSSCPFVPRGPVNNAGQPVAGGRLWVDRRQKPPEKLGLRECPQLLNSGLGLAQQEEAWADESPDRGSQSKLEAELVCLAHRLGSDLPVQAFRGRGPGGLAVLLLCSESGLSAVLSARRRRSPPPRSLCPSVTAEFAVCGAGHPGFVSGRWGVFSFGFVFHLRMPGPCLEPMK